MFDDRIFDPINEFSDRVEIGSVRINTVARLVDQYDQPAPVFLSPPNSEFIFIAHFNHDLEYVEYVTGIGDLIRDTTEATFYHPTGIRGEVWWTKGRELQLLVLSHHEIETLEADFLRLVEAAEKPPVYAV